MGDRGLQSDFVATTAASMGLIRQDIVLCRGYLPTYAAFFLAGTFALA